MKNIYIGGAVAAFLLVAVVISGVFTTKGQVAGVSTGPIKIGAIMILTGQGAATGEASRNGMALAIEDINKNGGINGRQLEAVYEDDNSDPKKTIAAFNKLTSADGVQFIIGPTWSKLGLAVKDLVPAAKVVMISPSLGVKEFNESSDYLFNTWPHDAVMSSALADYVYAQGHRTVALFGAQDDWVKEQTKVFTARFTELGGTVAFTYEPTVETTDVRTEVAKVRTNKKIDALVMTTDGYGLTDIIAKQAREGGVTVPFFNITTDNKIIADCGKYCEGMVFPSFLTPTKEFSAHYQARYDREVEVGADSAYDAVMMLADAMKATNSTDPEKVKVYLANIKNYEGASGSLVSDGKRAFTKDYVLKVVHNALPVDLKK